MDSNRDPTFEALGVVSDFLEPLAWAIPAFAIAVAVIIDRQVLARQRNQNPELLLAGETAAAGSGTFTVARFALMRPPWTALVGVRFAQHRRSTMYSLDRYSMDRYASDADNPGHIQLVEETRSNVEQINNTGDPTAWQGLGLARQILTGNKPEDASTANWLLRRWWPLLLWLAIAAPAVIFYGSSPTTNGAVKTFAANQAFPVLVGVAAIATLWAALRLLAVGRALVRGEVKDDHNAMTGLILRCWIGTGTLILSGVVLQAVAAGNDAGQRFWSNSFHIITALGSLLLVAGLALIIAAVIFFPPVAMVAVAGGGTLLVPTLTTGLIISVTAGTGLGVAGYALGQANQQATGRRPQTSAGRADGPSQTGISGSPLPPGIPTGAAVAATIDAAGRIILTDAPGDQPVPEPAIEIDQHKYEDLNGNVRWKDTNQLVTDIPTRPIYQDEDGTWRFADTHKPTGGFDPNGPEAEVLRDQWGIDPDQIGGAAHDLERLVADATNKPVGSGDGVGARGELAAIRDAQANGQQVARIFDDSKGSSPDLLIDGVATEVKSRELPFEPLERHSWFEERVKRAGRQLERSTSGSGDVQLRLSHEAVTSLDLAEVNRQIAKGTGHSTSQAIRSITVYDETGKTLTRWTQTPEGTWANNG